MTTKEEHNHLEPDEFKLNNKNAQLYDDDDLFLDDIGDITDVLELNRMDKNPEQPLPLESKKPKGDNFDIQSFNEEKRKDDIENRHSNPPVPSPDKKDGLTWQFGDHVKRDAFGFISRTEPLKDVNNENSKKSESDDEREEKKGEDDVDLRDVLNKRKGDKKDDTKPKRNSDIERYEEGKKRDRDRDRDEKDGDKYRDRNRSPHSYRRRRSPSPRRSRYRRSRSRSRSPRDPRRDAKRRSPRHPKAPWDREREYDRRYRRYSSDKSPELESEKSEKRESSPSRGTSSDWMHGHGNRNPPPPMNPVPEYNMQMGHPQFRAPTNAPGPPPGNPTGVPPPGTEGNEFNRFPQSSHGRGHPQYNYPSGPGGPNPPPSYPGYDVYYPGYPPPPSHPPEYIPTPTNSWQHDMSQPPPKVPPARPPEDPAKKEAIEKELLQQKITLSMQRDEYLRKGIVLNRELELLKAQKKDLLADKSRDNEKILKENHKLQTEINSKIKAVDNVIDMLTGIIGDSRPTMPLEPAPEELAKPGKGSSKEKHKSRSISKEKVIEKKKSEKRSKESSGTEDNDSSNESSESNSDAETRKKSRKNKKKKKKKTDSTDENLAPPGTESVFPLPELKKDEGKPLFNYVFYDPEMHWCRVCDEFPRTAKEYLNHLHSKEHRQLTQDKKLNDMPWHDLNVHEEMPFHEGAPVKRTPIKGLQFFVSATAWFCKLCHVWIGDLHCASLHLKSKEHSTNYSKFNEQNPHWETDWMADREKAYEKCAEQRRRQRDEELLQKQQKEHIESLKKQEEELKQKFFPSMLKLEPETELLMPLTLPRTFEGPALPPKDAEVKKEKEKKKKTKRDKKKKEKKSKEKSKKRSKDKKSKKSSSSESSSSLDSSSSSSDSDDEDGKFRRNVLADLEGRSKSIRVSMRNKAKLEEAKNSSPPLPPPSASLQITLPERSKWEDDVPESKPVKPVEEKVLQETFRERTEKETDDRMLKEWMKSDLTEPEKEMAKNLKEKLKTKEKQKDSHSEKEERRWDWNKSVDEERESRYEKKRNYRDKRPDRKDKERDRKKDYRSRYRRSRSRSRSRDRSRSREKVTPGVIPAPLYDLFKLPEKHTVTLPESKSDSHKESRRAETDDSESKFEKQAVEAAKKKKVQPVMNLPKSKFGFIGRMPFAKKRNESDKQKKDEDGVDSKGDNPDVEAPPPPRITQQRQGSPKNNAKPVLTNKTKVETAKEIVSKYQKVLQEKIEDARPMDPVDMEIEMPNPPLPPSPPILTMMPPSPPKIREPPKSPKKSKKAAKELPKDFQDALSIIYPEEKTEEYDVGNTLSFRPLPMNYAMMGYPGMHAMAPVPRRIPPGPPVGLPPVLAVDADGSSGMYVPPPPSDEPSPPRDAPSPTPPPPPENLFESAFGLGSSIGGGIPGLDDDKMETSSKMSDDDMALLGIDAEDLAAQQL